MKAFHTLSRLVALSLILAPKTILACAVCMGGSESNVRPAINGAIFLMLGFIGTMLTGVSGFAFYLFRRSKMHPPHEQFLYNEE